MLTSDADTQHQINLTNGTDFILIFCQISVRIISEVHVQLGEVQTFSTQIGITTLNVLSAISLEGTNEVKS